VQCSADLATYRTTTRLPPFSRQHCSLSPVYSVAFSQRMRSCCLLVQTTAATALLLRHSSNPCVFARSSWASRATSSSPSSSSLTLFGLATRRAASTGGTVSSAAANKATLSSTARAVSRRMMASASSSTKSTAEKSAACPTNNNNSSINRKATKHLWVLRHGQATHNPRAEAAKDAGCTHDEFLELMRQDDSLDSDLTELGCRQAQDVYERHVAPDLDYWKSQIELVVSSPLSRAIRTADLAVPPSLFESDSSGGEDGAQPRRRRRRVVREEFREINGWLLNAKRKTKTHLSDAFPHWDFDELEHDDDVHWTPTLEDVAACADRGYRGLRWLLDRPERRTFLVAHGGILRFVMSEHPRVAVRDERRLSCGGTAATSKSGGDDDNGGGEGRQPQRPPTARFRNCELRRYRLEYDEDEDDHSVNEQRRIVLTEVDLFDETDDAGVN